MQGKTGRFSSFCARTSGDTPKVPRRMAWLPWSTALSWRRSPRKCRCATPCCPKTNWPVAGGSASRHYSVGEHPTRGLAGTKGNTASGLGRQRQILAGGDLAMGAGQQRRRPTSGTTGDPGQDRSRRCARQSATLVRTGPCAGLIQRVNPPVRSRCCARRRAISSVRPVRATA